MSSQDVLRDERTVSTENASYRWAYLFMTYGLLVDTMWRSYFRGQAPWDLLAFVILGGAVSLVYQWRGSVLTWRWVKLSAASALLAAVIAALLVVLR
jgi:hypothetical protein